MQEQQCLQNIPISVTYDIGTPKHDQEGRTITWEFDRFYLVAVYVPNAGSKLKWLEYRTTEWDVDFRNYLKGLELKGKPVILVGDLNIAYLDIDVYNPAEYERYPCFTPEEKASFNTFQSLGFVDTFRHIYPGKVKFSFWDVRGNMRRDNKGWRLDYAIVSEAILNSVLDSEIHSEYWGSDHWPISITLDLSKIDLKAFNEAINWDDILNDDKSDMDFEEDKLDMDFGFEDIDENDSNEEIPKKPDDTLQRENEENFEEAHSDRDNDSVYSYETPPDDFNF